MEVSEKVPARSVRSFEDLRIWQQARSFVGEVYSDFRQGTAGEADLGFCWQIEKAAVSIMNNIAEGFERSSDAEFARFLDIAKGSSGEVRSMYYAAEDLTYVSTETATARREKGASTRGGRSARRARSISGFGTTSVWKQWTMRGVSR